MNNIGKANLSQMCVEPGEQTSSSRNQRTNWTENDQRICERMRLKEWGRWLPLTIKQMNMREKLFNWVLEQGRSLLELKNKTIQLAMRLFDYFILKQYEENRDGARIKMILRKEKIKTVLDEAEESRLLLITCLFTCSKYVQIYPPCLNDFLYLLNDKYERAVLLKKQIEVLAVTDCALTQITVSQWYQHLYGERMPEWGYRCYTKLMDHPLQVIAKSIYTLRHSDSPFMKENKDKSVLKEAVQIKNLSK